MDHEELRSIIKDQQLRKPRQHLITRDCYPHLKQRMKSPFVIVLAGMRRTGKTTLLYQIRSEQDGYYVNFDDERLLDFTVKDFQLLEQVLIEAFGEKETYYFDEIQNISGWERFVRRLHDQQHKVVITGSNAAMLSLEFGTHLTGRNIVMEVFPFSFREYLRFQEQSLVAETAKQQSLIKRQLNRYLRKGGLPEYLQTGNQEYLKNLYDNILYRDIIVRHNLAQASLKETAKYVMSNIAKEISNNQIRKLAGLTSATTVKQYLSHLQDAYLLFTLSRYARSLKKQIYFNKKVYAIDTKLAQMIGFRQDEDRGRVLENAVFLELRRRNKEVYFHRGKNECDFLIREGTTITEAIQVTEHLKSNQQRELDGLHEAMALSKAAKGIIITLDEERKINNKIKVIPLWKWLMQEE